MEPRHLIPALLLAAATAGCFGHDRRLYVEDVFSPEERRTIYEAASAWNDEAGSVLFEQAGTFPSHHPFDFERDYLGAHESMAVHKVSRSDPGYPELLEDAGTADDVAGIANVDYGRAALVKEDIFVMTTDELRSLAMHELGHLVGLHHNGRRDVMDPGPEYATTDVDAETRAELCEAEDCGSGR